MADHRAAQVIKQPLITVAVPSLNQGDYLDAALTSLFRQHVPIEVFVVDGGSTDQSVEVIRRWEPQLAGWRSRRDAGQSAAINEAIRQGTAPYVTWLNSDDLIEDGGLARLLDELEHHPETDMVYGRAFNLYQRTGRRSPVWVEPFSTRRLANRCIISQPAALIRRSAWTRVAGLRIDLQMAMDYDLWWRLHRAGSRFSFVDTFVASSRIHGSMKTRRFRRQHYAEAIATVQQHNGSVPLKWTLLRPYAVWLRSMWPRLP